MSEARVRPPVESIVQVHDEVDRQAHHLIVLHAERLQCKRGCSACCVDELTVFAVEADVIRLHHPALLAAGLPHDAGACAFLDLEGACRIYADRPYVCRTQGLPLRWITEDTEGKDVSTEPRDLVEMRDICPLNETTEPIELLKAEECWTLGPIEEELARVQLQADPVEGRVRLRSLFAPTSSS